MTASSSVNARHSSFESPSLFEACAQDAGMALRKGLHVDGADLVCIVFTEQHLGFEVGNPEPDPRLPAARDPDNLNRRLPKSVWDAHRAFCDAWKIDYPLHSHQIRGGRGNFSWLKNPERAVEFLRELEEFLVNLPVMGIAAIIHRPGYVARYAEQYEGSHWRMDKTAFSILIERSAKYARSKGRRLRVFYERAGNREDQDIVAFMENLKTEGMPFDGKNSAAYHGLAAAEFDALVLGKPNRRTKKTPMIQIADLYLYPMAKAGYDDNYKPYLALMKAGRLIDSVLPPENRSLLGIKYSCFDGVDRHKRT